MAFSGKRNFSCGKFRAAIPTGGRIVRSCFKRGRKVTGNFAACEVWLLPFCGIVVGRLGPLNSSSKLFSTLLGSKIVPFSIAIFATKSSASFGDMGWNVSNKFLNFLCSCVSLVNASAG